MADKRMFNKKITTSDAFLEMPATTQCLYFHLNMEADDDGFVNNPRRIMRDVRAAEDDLRMLIAKSFVLLFDSGVIVIKHWRMHNCIQKDRYKPTDYIEEKALLTVKENKAYSFNSGLYTECIQDGNTDKIRLDKNRLDKNSEEESEGKQSSRFVPPTLDEIKDYIWEKGYKNVDAEHFFNYYESNGWMVGKTKMKKWKAAVANWEHNGYGSGGKGKEKRSDGVDLIDGFL